MHVTVDQLKDLWTRGGSIDRGPRTPPVTPGDLSALASQIDTDDEGMPATEDDWQALADQLNSSVGRSVGDARDAALEDVENAARDLVAATDDRDRAIRAAIALGVPVVRIAAAAGLSTPRIYQIRDGRR